MRKAYTPYVVPEIILAVITLLILVPFVWLFFNSFKTNTEIFAGGSLLPANFAFDNYVFAWVRGSFSQYFLNSVLTTAGIVLLRLALVCPASYAFAKLHIRKYPWVFYCFLIGLAIPSEAFVISLFLQIRDIGLINTLPGLILPLAFIGLPFSIFLLRNYFIDMPNALKESAIMDGAGTLSVFFRIMLPLAKPSLLVIAVLSFLDGWNEYMLFMLVLITPDTKTIPLGLVKFSSEYIRNFGAVFAGTMLAIVPSVLIYCLLQRTFINGLTIGAVKG
jgi:ABC-type glycerol-3-phosphate transport system permease component